MFDQIKRLNPENRLFGFILGPGGFVDHNYKELTKEVIDEYRNTGGFDMIGSGRTKLEKVEQFEKGLEIARELNLSAIVIIGGDDSNTNACVLAEYYAAKNYGIQVIGCPKTIDGDLKNEQIETSFGFDTACKTYSELIGNIERDCNSARKYWHFIKVMGRSASHIALECALQCQPNVCLVSEEVEQKDMTLNQIVDDLCQNIFKGAQIPLKNEDGNFFIGTVLEIGDASVKIDLNHPLAGKKLNFKGYIIENREATMDEIKTMLSHMNGGGCGGDCGGCEGGCGHHEGGCGHHDHEDGCCGSHEHKGGCCGHHN